MPEEISNVCNKISVDTVHVTWGGYNSIHIFVTVMNTFLYLGKIEISMLRNSRQTPPPTNCFKTFILSVVFWKNQNQISVRLKNKKQASDLPKVDAE